MRGGGVGVSSVRLSAVGGVAVVDRGIVCGVHMHGGVFRCKHTPRISGVHRHIMCGVEGLIAFGVAPAELQEPGRVVATAVHCILVVGDMVRGLGRIAVFAFFQH